MRFHAYFILSRVSCKDVTSFAYWAFFSPALLIQPKMTMLMVLLVRVTSLYQATNIAQLSTACRTTLVRIKMHEII